MKNMFETPVCEICNDNTARYRCKSCGKNVCETHFNRDIWLCIECVTRYRERRVELEKEVGGIFLYGFAVIAVVVVLAIGFIIILTNTQGIGKTVSDILPFLDLPDYVYEIGISFIFFAIAMVFLGLFLKQVYRRTME